MIYRNRYYVPRYLPKVSALPRQLTWTHNLIINAYIGKEELPWLSTDQVLSQFSDELLQARKKYAEFVRDGAGEGRRKEFSSGLVEGRILGDDCFAEDALQKAGQQHSQTNSLDEILAIVCQHFNVTVTDIAAIGKTKQHSVVRAVMALLIREPARHSLTELGTRLNRDVASLSQAARRLAACIDVNPELARSVSMLKEQLTA